MIFFGFSRAGFHNGTDRHRAAVHAAPLSVSGFAISIDCGEL